MAQAVTEAVTRQLPNFKLGQKQVFLPGNVITLLRKDHQPANWATFQVPLRFTKFDLRDYLWNLYNVEATAVRSWVKQAPISRKGGNGRFFRPQSSKFMTIEMTQPFVWPAVPENLEPWDKKLHDARERAQKQQSTAAKMKQLGNLGSPRKDGQTPERKRLAELASKYQTGELKWTNDAVLDEKWDTKKGDSARSGAKSQAKTARR